MFINSNLSNRDFYTISIKVPSLKGCLKLVSKSHKSLNLSPVPMKSSENTVRIVFFFISGGINTALCYQKILLAPKPV